MLVRKRSSINNPLFILAAHRNVPSRLNTAASPLHRGAGGSVPALPVPRALLRTMPCQVCQGPAPKEHRAGEENNREGPEGFSVSVFFFNHFSCNEAQKVLLAPGDGCFPSCFILCVYPPAQLSQLPHFPWLLCSKHHQAVKVLLSANRFILPKAL